jgi:hypothetical protein
MRIVDRIEIKSNLKLTVYERGKIVTIREGHNIWLDVGREFVLQLMSFQSFNPDVPIRSDRIKYMAVGIGGTGQKQLAQANVAPLSPPYVGTNVQDDETPTVTTLERPVRISGSSSNYPGLAGDIWAGTIQAPPDLSVGTRAVYRRVFTGLEVSYGPFVSVPISEIALMTSLADPGNYLNQAVAYDTFDTVSKTGAASIEAVWTLNI